MIYTILVGALVGWLAGKLLKGGGFGPLYNILLGIAGGIVGSWLINLFNRVVMTGLLGDIVKGLIGAALVLFIADLLKKD